MAKEEKKICSICGEEYDGWGNNAWPINEERCCDACKRNLVLPARISRCSNEHECYVWLLKIVAKSFKEYRYGT